MESLNPNIRVMEYAVRGPIVARAAEIEKELKQVRSYDVIDSSLNLHFLFISQINLFTLHYLLTYLIY